MLRFNNTIAMLYSLVLALLKQTYQISIIGKYFVKSMLFAVEASLRGVTTARFFAFNVVI